MVRKDRIYRRLIKAKANATNISPLDVTIERGRETTQMLQ